MVSAVLGAVAFFSVPGLLGSGSFSTPDTPVGYQNRSLIICTESKAICESLLVLRQWHPEQFND